MSSLFSALLGDAFDRLPPRVRAIHAATGSHTYRGVADVDRGDGILSRLLCMASSLPLAGRDIPITVTIETNGSTEQWRRDFGGHPMQSALSRADDLLREKLGVATFRFRLTVERDVLVWRVASVRVLGISLPSRWFNGVVACESDAGGRYRFDVRAELLGVGMLVHYRGWLDVD